MTRPRWWAPYQYCCGPLLILLQTELQGDRARSRQLDLLHKKAQESAAAPAPSRALHMHFLWSPDAFLAGPNGRLSALRIRRNRLEGQPGSLRAVPTSHTSELPCELAVRSVGYSPRQVPGLALDPARPQLANVRGRVQPQPGADPRPGWYVAGWLKRGPSGIIGGGRGWALC